MGGALNMPIYFKHSLSSIKRNYSALYLEVDIKKIYNFASKANNLHMVLSLLKDTLCIQKQ